VLRSRHPRCPRLRAAQFLRAGLDLIAMQCNIDARGKAVRLIAGSVVAVVGALLMILWAAGGSSAAAWTISIACLLLGSFMIFEGRTGWCVVRAMGIKTRI
jgi:hypothetical protein